MARLTLLTRAKCHYELFPMEKDIYFRNTSQEYPDEKQSTGLHAVNKFGCLQSVLKHISPMWKRDFDIMAPTTLYRLTFMLLKKATCSM